MRLAIGVGFLLLVVLAAGLGLAPAWVPVVYVAASAGSLLMYSGDKVAAGARRRRIPEKTLHLVDLIGGWPGGLAGQQLSRHKTAKASFQAVFLFTVAVNMAAMAWLVHTLHP